MDKKRGTGVKDIKLLKKISKNRHCSCSQEVISVPNEFECNLTSIFYVYSWTTFHFPPKGVHNFQLVIITTNPK